MEGEKRLHWTSMLIQIQQFIWTVFISLLGVRNIAGEYLYLAFAAILTLFGAFIFIRWRRFRYHLRADEIYSVAGGIFKKETNIPYSQIQAVDVKMGIIHRIFKVSQVDIKTASKGSQLSLTINRDAAKALRSTIEQRRGLNNDVADLSIDEEVAPLQRRSLTTKETLIAAATSKQFLVSLGVTGVIYDYLTTLFGWQFLQISLESFGEDGFDWGSFDPTPFLAIGVIAFLALCATVVYTLLVYRSFGIAKRADELSIRSGFTNITEVDLPTRRIQSVVIKQTPLALLLGYGQMQIRVIGHSEEKGRNTIVHPCIAESDWQTFLDEFIPGFHIADEKVRAPLRALPFYIFRTTSVLTVLALLSIIPLYQFVSTWALSALLFIIPLFFFALLLGFANYWFSTIGRKGTSLNFISQPWSRSTSVVRKDAFQRYELRQGFFQRKIGTVNLALQIASGPIGVMCRMRDLAESETEKFSNWLGVKS